MTIRIRTGYSFRSAVGRVDSVISRLAEIGSQYAPITDTASTFGWTKWKKAATKAGMKPVFGVELAVSPAIHEKKPAVDFWTFIAKDSIVPINELVSLATQQFRYQPLLRTDQAWPRDDVWQIMGTRTDFSSVPAADHRFVALTPSLPKAQLRNALKAGHRPIAASDNRYPAEGGQGFYETVCGRNASTQSYPQWIMSDKEWSEDALRRFGAEFSDAIGEALANRDLVLESSSADLVQAEMVHPPRPKSLEQMCIDGAQELGCDLSDPEYADRLKRELGLIASKGYEDYFFLVADICQWARKRMIVGPARGSSCGSLVCYLLKITTVDPLPYGLLFERFIDINRNDMPDIDIDFPEDRRAEVFEYVAKTYGREKVARLGTVAMYQPRSALKEAAGAMDIAPWLLNPVMDAIVERSSGDSRALQATEDTLRDTAAGKDFLDKYPEILVATQMEGHPRHAGQHAAGIVITEHPTLNYVAVDQRTGAAMCDKKDAEDLNLLKIDALGLTQLSIFEYTLKLAGLPQDFLESIPLDDPKAFEVLNKHRYAGIFQFMGLALQSITDQVEIKELNDIVAITALARPGPLNTGGTNHWIKVKTGREPETYPHPLFEPYLKSTLGVVAYQEQVMIIGREIGGLSWEDVTALRKAMSKSLGKEFFDQYGDKWKAGARAKGVPEEVLTKVWDDLCLSGDTKLLNPFPSKGDHKYMTLRQLYERGGMGPSKGGAAKRKRQSLLMWDGESLKPFENWGVKYSGKKVTFEVVTASGNRIRATPEHKFMMGDGSYEELKDLIPGDFLMSDGGASPTPRKEPKKTGSGGHNWWHKLKAGEPSYAEGVRYLKAMFKKCQSCKDAPYEETHHINGDHEDHSIENLLPVCRSCHKKLHAVMQGGYPVPWGKGRSIFPDEIVSITEWGEEDVYDIHMPDPHNNFLAEGVVVHNCAYGSWAFNMSHAVAYGLVSYYCCYLKAHYPLEFAAATLSYTDTPESQIKMLRELAAEGVDYLPVDEATSTDRWAVKHDESGSWLVGPLSNVSGIGPKMMTTILSARKRNEPLPERVKKLLAKPRTKIDSLWPVEDAFKRLIPDRVAANILTEPTKICDVQVDGSEQEVVVLCVVEQIKPKDENEEINVAKRGGRRLTGPTNSLNLRLADDTDVVFAKINRFDFERIGKEIIERGRPGKSLYVVKGNVPRDFRMISVKKVRYVGDLDKLPEE